MKVHYYGKKYIWSKVCTVHFVYKYSNNQATGPEPGPGPVLGPKEMDWDQDQLLGPEMTGARPGTNYWDQKSALHKSASVTAPWKKWII